MKINKMDPNHQTHVYPTVDAKKVKKEDPKAAKKGKKGAIKKGWNGFGNPYRNPS